MGRTRAKVRATKWRRNFSQPMHPIHPIGPKTDILFPTIWVHSGSFSCLTKLGAKHAELVQKFVPQSCVGIFRNECTRSTPLDPKLMFGAFRTIWVHSGPFGCLMKLGAKRAELVQKFVPRSRVRICRNKPTRSTPLDPKLMFWCISYHLGAFATIRLPYETRGKTF